MLEAGSMMGGAMRSLGRRVPLCSSSEFDEVNQQAVGNMLIKIKLTWLAAEEGCAD